VNGPEPAASPAVPVSLNLPGRVARGQPRAGPGAGPGAPAPAPGLALSERPSDSESGSPEFDSEAHRAGTVRLGVRNLNGV
jgi:hypothetical protein